MLTQEALHKHQDDSKQAIFDRFEGLGVESKDISKSEEGASPEVYYTEEALNTFKDDLYKAIDDGDLSPDTIEKAKTDLSDLRKVTREVDGEQVKVYVKS